MRRAWIEIGNGADGKEPGTASPSGRRAWIEINSEISVKDDVAVALREEGVD